MNPSPARFCLIVLVTLNQSSLAQDKIQPRNKINFVVEAAVRDAGVKGLKEYVYSLSSLSTSQQNVWRFWVITRDTASIQTPTRPPGWFKVIVDINKVKPELTVDWGTPSALGVKPGGPTMALSFSSRSLPGTCAYYAEGYAPPPSFEPGNAPDSIPGYTNLTPYGPGVVGKTIGPVLPPDPFDPGGFLDTLISYTQQSFSLGWIHAQSVSDKYVGLFTSAKTRLQGNDTTAARTDLQQVLQQLDVDSTASLSSEAYALLRFNTEYLLSKLPKPPEVTISDLVRLKHEAFSKGWIGDEQFVKELDNGLDNAKKHLARRDSVNSAKELEKFLDKLKKEYDKSLEDRRKGRPRDKRFVTAEAYESLSSASQNILSKLPRKKK